MSPANIKVVFIGAICFVIWGGYNIAKVVYTSANWEKTEGIIVDIERHSMSCGKGVGECYSLIVGYHANKNYFTVNSKKKFNRDKPTHLLEESVEVYYSPSDPSDSIISGKYGPQNYGIILFLIGSVVLFVFWVKRKKD